MGYVGNQTTNSYTSLDKQTITGNGGASYTLDHAVANEQEIEVFVNNVRQEPSVAYTVSGTALTMTGNVESSDDFYVVFQGKAIQTTSHPEGQDLKARDGTFSGDVEVKQANSLGSSFTGTARGEGLRVTQTDYTAGNFVSLIEAPYDDGNASANIRIGGMFNSSGSNLSFGTSNSYGSGITNEAMRIDSSGHVVIGKTATSEATDGHAFLEYGQAIFTRASGYPLVVRADANKVLTAFKSGANIAGQIGVTTKGGYANIYIGRSGTGLYFRDFGDAITPSNATDGSDRDNVIDLGHSSIRFDDIYATNGTIQTSDQNEKQQIASLTSAEITAAKAISKLFKTFKWNDSVAENGDNARTHTGVIAQQVETAMTDAGLDAGDYAFFISTDWYVDANGEEVEADAEGAIAKNRKGIRYPQLLAFVGAATEQRLADIETRLTALEAN